MAIGSGRSKVGCRHTGASQPTAMEHAVVLAAAGLVSGAMNAIAGGGSFVSFPALIAAGLPPVLANAAISARG